MSYLGEDIRKLGFGLMRLPQTDGVIDVEHWLVGGHGLKRANECVKCGKCEEACPQHIQIRAELEHVSEELLK